MCGILGIVAQQSNTYEGSMKDMVAAQRHRGPDENNVVFFDNCALGHNRLSIVDLSCGQQPMYSDDQKKAIVFNGEIYGYEKLMAELQSRYPFKTKSDTEVILALYENKKYDLTKELPGMFSFAIWNDLDQSLFCSRDRFGEKPFYYAFGKGGEFIFASEIKTILASGLITPTLDKQSLTHYLKHLYVPADKTIYINIHTLPPAHTLTYKDGKVHVEHYWQLPTAKSDLTLEAATSKFRELLDESIKKQLVADVPVGAFLSGGLDSSTVVAVASEHKKNLQTFAFEVDGDGKSELPYAKEAAVMYHTDHREVFVDQDIAEVLLKMADVYDEPFADSSNIPLYLISKEASKFLRVFLTGDGGDELFGGYGWYKNHLFYNEHAKQHDSKTTFLFWKILHKLTGGFKHQYIKSQTSYLSGNYKNPADFHKSLNTYFNEKELAELCLFETKNSTTQPATNAADPTHFDLLDYMPGDILTKIDRASMANSIELRAPFLDVDFASFCASLPFSYKMDQESNKRILRQAFTDKWPSSIKNRSKQGFGAPVKKWLQLPSVEKIRTEYLDDRQKKIFQLISFEKSRGYVQQKNYKTWILLVLSIWLEKHPYTIN